MNIYVLVTVEHFFFNTDNCLGFDYHGSTLSGLGKRESVLNIRDKITKEIKLYK